MIFFSPPSCQIKQNLAVHDLLAWAAVTQVSERLKLEKGGETSALIQTPVQIKKKQKQNVTSQTTKQPSDPSLPPSLPHPKNKIKTREKQRIQKTVSPPSPQAQSLTRLQMSRVQWNEEERWDTDGGILGLSGYKSEHYGGQLSACRSFKKGGPQVNSAHLLNSK